MRKFCIFLAVVYLAVVVGINLVQEGILGSAVRVAGVPLLFFWLLYKFQNPRIRKLTWLHFGFALYLVFGLISLQWTVDATATITIFWRYLFMFGMTVVVWDICRTAEDAEWLTQGYIFGAFIAFLQTFGNFLAKRAYYGTDRYGAEGLHPNVAALLLATAAPISWMLATNALHLPKIVRAFNYVFPLIALFGISLTGSRGGALAAVFGYLYIVSTIVRRPVGAGALAISLAFAIPAALSQPEIQRNLDRVLNMATNSQADNFSGRETLWEAARQLFYTHPLTGVGLGAYRTGSLQIGTYMINDVGIASGAHNTYLEILAELGIPGLIFFLIAMLAVGKSILKMPNAYRYAWLAGFIAYMFLMTYEMIQWRYFLWAFMVCGINHYYCLANDAREKELAESPTPTPKRVRLVTT